MKRFLIFANSMNDRIGTETTMEKALEVIRFRNNGHGNIVELNDKGDYYKAYGIRGNKVRKWYRLNS